ncbi:MAG: nucleotidyltransferase family protein [Xenococcus sp. (in: cyanobacteria)]
MKLTREQILQKLKENHLYLSSKYGLKRIGLFGSYANGTQVETSDIDIIVEFNRPIGLKFMEFTEYLEDLLEKKIDVLTTVGLEGIRNSKIAQNIKETIIYV